MATSNRRRRAPLEVGATEAGQVEEIRVPLSKVDVEVPDEAEAVPAPLKVEADLTGAEVASLRLRNDIVDRAVEEAKKAREDATEKLRVAQLLQSELTLTVNEIVRQYGLSEGYPYRADLERGKILVDRR